MAADTLLSVRQLILREATFLTEGIEHPRAKLYLLPALASNIKRFVPADEKTITTVLLGEFFQSEDDFTRGEHDL